MEGDDRQKEESSSHPVSHGSHCHACGGQRCSVFSVPWKCSTLVLLMAQGLVLKGAEIWGVTSVGTALGVLGSSVHSAPSVWPPEGFRVPQPACWVTSVTFAPGRHPMHVGSPMGALTHRVQAYRSGAHLCSHACGSPQ